MSEADIRALLERAIEIAGSQTKLAELCGVKQQSIWGAKEIGRCSFELANRIELALQGQVRARDLCPEFPWPQIDDTDSTRQPERAAS